VAMKDLEIRGAGNLLGGEQSGHIAGVGFDLYVRMVSEAVQEFRGGKGEEAPLEVKVDLPVDAHLPHGYAPSERLRLEMYRKIAEVNDAERLADVEAEMTDRYGAPPEAVRNLLEVARLRLLARQYGVTEISLQGTHIRLAPVDLPESRQMRLRRLYPKAVYKQAVRTISVPRPTEGDRMGSPQLRDRELMNWVRNLLDGVLGPM
jgi:transcription-repair coupling factor (superfamily II helicase)